MNDAAADAEEKDFGRMDLVTEKVILPRGPALVPASGYDFELFENVPVGRKYATTIRYHRTLPLHNWYWAFVSIVADALGMPAQTLHMELKRKAGLIAHIFPDGCMVLKSTSFKSMDEIEFMQYVKIAKEIVFSDYLPGLRAAERKEIFAMVEEKSGTPMPHELMVKG